MYRLLNAGLVLAILCTAACDETDPPPKDTGPGADTGQQDSGPGYDSDVQQDSGGTQTDSGAQYATTTIYKINDGTVHENTLVELPKVVVTAIDGNGQYTGNVFVQEEAGGPGAGLLLYRPERADSGDIDDLQVGDRVKVQGKLIYYDGPSTAPFTNYKVKELDYKAKVTRLGPGAAPTPQALTQADLKDDKVLEKYSGMLVKVGPVKVLTAKDKYNDFSVSGDLDVTEELHSYTSTVGDCLDVTGILYYFYEYKLGPRMGADVTTATGCPTTKQIKISDIQDTTSANHPTAGDQVKVTGVITAVDAAVYGTATKFEGFWIQEEGQNGPYSGIYVYHLWDSSSSPIPKEGDKIELSGTYKEYYGVSELTNVGWTVTGTATVPAPAMVAAADVATGGSKAEQYEGVLVQVSSFKADTYVTSTGGTKLGVQDSSSKLMLESTLYDFMTTPPTLPTTYKTVTGPLHYSWNNFKILPRKAGDLVQ